MTCHYFFLYVAFEAQLKKTSATESLGKECVNFNCLHQVSPILEKDGKFVSHIRLTDIRLRPPMPFAGGVKFLAFDVSIVYPLFCEHLWSSEFWRPLICCLVFLWSTLREVEMALAVGASCVVSLVLSILTMSGMQMLKPSLVARSELTISWYVALELFYFYVLWMNTCKFVFCSHFSQGGTIAAGFLGSLLFVFLLTCLGNLERLLFGHGFQVRAAASSIAISIS